MIELFNLMKVDLVCLGNHEFDFGNEILKKRIRESKFDWLATNVINKKTKKVFDGCKDYLILDIESIKVYIPNLILNIFRLDFFHYVHWIL